MTTKTSIFARLYDLSQDLWWTGDPWANDIFQALILCDGKISTTTLCVAIGVPTKPTKKSPRRNGSQVLLY